MFSKSLVSLSDFLLYRNLYVVGRTIVFFLIITFIMLLLTTLSPLYSQTIQSEDSTLIGYWNFNECSGDTVHDLSMYENHGIITGANWVDLGGGNCGLLFDKPGEFVKVQNNSSLNQLSQLSMEAVIMIDSVPNDTYNHVMLTKEYNYNFYLWTADSTVRAGVYCAGLWVAVKSKSRINFGIPVYVAVTIDKSTTEMKIYINGLLDGDTTDSRIADWGGTSDPDLLFGINYTEGHQFYGKIEWLRLWRKIVTFGLDSYSLTSPSNDDSVKTPVSLSWRTSDSHVPDNNIRYDLYLSRSLIFAPESTIVYDSLTDTTLTDSLDLKTWNWKVKAYDKLGAVRWSDQSWSFYVYMCGDDNMDGKITVSDVVYEINYLFKGGSAPVPLKAGDVNCDGKNTVSDVVYKINYLFKGGPKLCQNCP